MNELKLACLVLHSFNDYRKRGFELLKVLISILKLSILKKKSSELQ